MIPVVNPATEEVVSEVPDSSVAEANAAVEAAYAAQKEWALHRPSSALNTYASYARRSETTRKCLPES